jgi:hypothetical protein
LVEEQISPGSREAAHPIQLFSSRSALPTLHEAERLPAMFEDSTHQLWRCETSDGPMMLKICQQRMQDKSGCWQIIENLFGRYLPRDLANIDAIQSTIEQHGRIPLPELVSWAGTSELFPAYILTRFVDGNMLEALHLNETIITQFATHIAQLHQLEYPYWGDLSQPQREAKRWSEALQQTLLDQAVISNINQDWLVQALAQLEQLEPATFTPIMLDNRWDQYLFESDRISALVDIDAFVAGPRELELVLLEYQLDNRQAALFCEIYNQYLPMPDLSKSRLSYRLLLFLMNALGETDIDKWMQAQVRFR